MALLELALDAVEIGSVEVVAGICLLDDIVVDDALFDGARVICDHRLLPVLSVVGHGG